MFCYRYKSTSPPEDVIVRYPSASASLATTHEHEAERVEDQFAATVHIYDEVSNEDTDPVMYPVSPRYQNVPRPSPSVGLLEDLLMMEDWIPRSPRSSWAGPATSPVLGTWLDLGPSPARPLTPSIEPGHSHQHSRNSNGTEHGWRKKSNGNGKKNSGGSKMKVASIQRSASQCTKLEQKARQHSFSELYEPPRSASPLVLHPGNNGKGSSVRLGNSGLIHCTGSCSNLKINSRSHIPVLKPESPKPEKHSTAKGEKTKRGDLPFNITTRTDSATVTGSEASAAANSPTRVDVLSQQKQAAASRNSKRRCPTPPRVLSPSLDTYTCELIADI